MNKEVTKAVNMMKKKEADKAAEIAKIEKELTASRAELEALKKGITTGETAEEYKNYLSKIRDTELVIDFFEKKKAALQAQGLTAEEYKSVTREVLAAAKKAKDEQSGAIYSEIEKLINLMAAYDADIAQLNNVLLDAARLHKVNPIILNAHDIAPANSDISHFVGAYYKVKSWRELKKRGLLA